MKKKTDDSKKVLMDHLKGVEIMPLKNHEIHHNKYDIIIEEGVPVAIPRIFLPNMVTEGVIKEIPKEG